MEGLHRPPALRRFRSEEAAREFDGSLHEHRREERSRQTTRHGQSGGVYPYTTASGTMWRYVARRTDGTQTSKRGFASEKAARDARRRLTERSERGEVRDTKETFGGFLGTVDGAPQALSASRARGRPMSATVDYGSSPPSGRSGSAPSDVARLRTLMDEWVEAIDAGTLAPKTINNTMGTLVVCLNGAVEDGLLPTNPALRVPRLPAGHIEREYLRLHEIPRYLESASTVYRPLAELLIGSGLRISEALGSGWETWSSSQSAG